MPIRIGVGSLNAAKIRATKSVLRRLKIPHRLRIESVSSGVSDQPRSEEETIQGALGRAQAILANTDAELSIGFEGGIDRTLFGTFACEWCAVRDRNGTIGLGGGPKILLPEMLAERVLAGQTLAAAAETCLSEGSTTQRGGVFALLTDDLVSREKVNAEALLLALARFVGAPTITGGHVSWAQLLAVRLCVRLREEAPRNENAPQQLALRLF
jgi:inosine/xanthosine triphosphatase